MSLLQAAGKSIANGIGSLGNYSANAAAAANGASAAAQNAQGQFNAGQAALANSIASDRIAEQYAYNSAQAAAANDFTMQMWDKSAEWNEMMWQKSADWNEAMLQKQMDFNSAEAQKSRAWQQKMMETAYQRAVTDMEKAGLNPILAVTGGGVSTGSGNGSAASVGGTSIGAPSMHGGTGQMASGGIVNGISASEGNYTGQMEYLGGTLGLISAAISAMSSAFTTFGQLGGFGKQMMEGFTNVMEGLSGKKSRDEDVKTNGAVNRYFRMKE